MAIMWALSLPLNFPSSHTLPAPPPKVSYLYYPWEGQGKEPAFIEPPRNAKHISVYALEDGNCRHVKVRTQAR